MIFSTYLIFSNIHNIRVDQHGAIDQHDEGITGHKGIASDNGEVVVEDQADGSDQTRFCRVWRRQGTEW